jgi:hypothetical protein
MRWIRWFGLLALAGLSGCGSEESRYKLVTVTGTVTLNGKPLGDAKVNFAPLEGNEYPTPGVDSTGPGGNYKLMFKGRSGIAAGKYKVTITPPDPSAAGSVPEAFKDDPAMFGFGEDARQQAASKNKKKVEAGNKSEFEAEVPEEGAILDFDVKSAATEPAKGK